MKYSHFEQTVEAAGLEPRRCSNDHWQIRGGERLVNVWPHSKKGFRFQVDGKKSQFGNVPLAIEFAGPPPNPIVEEAPSPWENTQGKPAIERVGLIRWLWRMFW